MCVLPDVYSVYIVLVIVCWNACSGFDYIVWFLRFLNPGVASEASSEDAAQPADPAVDNALLPQPAAADVEDRAAEVDPPPWDNLFPRRNVYRNAIVEYALPHLLRLLKDPQNRLTNSRSLVNEALELCRRDGNSFWGSHDVYSRKRTAVDAILCHYFGTLQDYVAGRAIVPL